MATNKHFLSINDAYLRLRASKSLFVIQMNQNKFLPENLPVTGFDSLCESEYSFDSQTSLISSQDCNVSLAYQRVGNKLLI